jgi:ATP-dependent DNA helicase RecG
LPGTLTLESLRHDHASVPNNPLIAESLYLTRYIERVGSGTQAMIELCRDANLPEPVFEIRQGFFVLTLWRDWLTNEVLAGFHLNERQLQAITHLKTHRRITNSEYQKLAGVIRKTAARDLNTLVEKGIVERRGEKRSSHYVLKRRQ